MSTRNKTSTLLAVIAAIVLVGAIGVWLAFRGDSSEPVRSVGGVSVDGETSEYVHEKTGLSFAYGDDYSVRLVTEQGIDSVVVQSEEDASRGLQVSILPFDEDPSTLTFERIQTDIPDIDIEKPQAGTLPFGSLALSFETGEGTFRTREVWFVREGYLYQISAPIASSGLVEGLIAVMEFR